CSLDGGVSGTGDLLSATTISFASSVVNINTNDPLTFGDPNVFQSLFTTTGNLTPTTINTSFPLNPMLLLFGTSYSFTAGSQVMSVNPSTRAVSFYSLGTFADSTNTYDPSPASLTLQFTQSAPDTSISGSGTFSAPPAPLTSSPEPATMGIM